MLCYIYIFRFATATEQREAPLRCGVIWPEGKARSWSPQLASRSPQPQPQQRMQRPRWENCWAAAPLRSESLTADRPPPYMKACYNNHIKLTLNKSCVIVFIILNRISIIEIVENENDAGEAWDLGTWVLGPSGNHLSPMGPS